MKKDSKPKYVRVVIIVFVILLLFLIAFGLLINRNKDKNINISVNDVRGIEDVQTPDEIYNRLGINLEMKASTSIGYFIEDEDIARIEYKARGMDFILKSSSDSAKDLTNLMQMWDTPILMTSICKDGTSIQVTSMVSVDNPKIMKAEWYDNDLYYSMDTKNLTTRENFLQEVNSIIIKYHEEVY